MQNIALTDNINYLHKAIKRTQENIRRYERWTISELNKSPTNKNKIDHYKFKKRIQQKMLISDYESLTNLQALLINLTEYSVLMDSAK
jgi:hypothetical protein